MQDLDLVIRGGTVATASDVFRADVGIKDGVIAALAANLPKGAQEIDALGKLVLPGGVDSHCHIDQMTSSGASTADDFISGTRSAAAGGTTTVICFSTQTKGGTIASNVRDYHERAKSALIDYSFHMIITDPNAAVMDELPSLIQEGHRSLKIFMTYDASMLRDPEILKVLALARRNGALVTVHAENHDAIAFLTEALIKSGRTEVKYQPWSKPIAVEREAVHRICTFSELLDVPLQIFHVSGAEAAEEIARAQQRGLKVFAETCTQYLVLTAADLHRPGFEGAKFLCSPAPRTRQDQDALWRYIRSGVLGIVSSDHSAYRYDGSRGKKLQGEDAPFNVVPNGVPGLETRLPVLFSEGVAQGRIDLTQFVAISATNAAKLFGIYPKKGTIAIGTDADIAVWDPCKTVTITNDKLHHNVDYTIFEGMQVQGWPVMTLSRGQVVCNAGRITAEPGWGRFLPRGPYEYIRPQGSFPTPFNPVDQTVTHTPSDHSA
jgi:dihydropyrimidinase